MMAAACSAGNLPDTTRRREHEAPRRRNRVRWRRYLVDDFPLLRSLVDRRAGGQKRLPMPGRGQERVPAPLFASVPAGHDVSEAGTLLVTTGVPAPEEPATPAHV